MSAHWCKVASNLDTHPKIRKAGRLGREIFLFALRRNAEPGNRVPGRISAEELDPDYLCDMLFVTRDEAVTGVTLAVTAGLLAREGEEYVILSWKDGWGKGGGSGAERTAKWRENKKLKNATVTRDTRDVTQCHGDTRDIDKTRSDKTIIGAAALAQPNPKRKRGSSLPADWAPRDAEAAKARAAGLDLDAEAQQFRDHHTAKGSVMADWDAAFRTWIRNAVKFASGRGTTAPTQQPMFRKVEEL